MDWFGGYQFRDDTPAPTDDFTIAFYTDAGGAPALVPFVTFSVGNSVNRVDTGMTFNCCAGLIEFSYSANINVDLVGGVQYYVSIFADTAGLTTDWFWSNSAALDENHWSCGPPVSSSTCPGWVASGLGSRAFTLNDATSVPEPGTLGLLGAGLLGLFMRRKRVA